MPIDIDADITRRRMEAQASEAEALSKTRIIEAFHKVVRENNIELDRQTSERIEREVVAFGQDLARIANRFTASEIEAMVKTEIIKNIERFHNIYDTFTKSSDFEIIDSNNPGNVGSHGMKKFSPFKGVQYDVPDYESMFIKSRVGPGFLGPNRGGNFHQPIPGGLRRKRNKNRLKNEDVFFSREDYENGFLTKEQFDAFGGDSSIYVPFFFEDLRKPDRRIYFRAFLTTFNETISPSWNKETFYGRIDPVAIHKSTERRFSIGFTIASFSPAGYSTMWKKVNHLSKMCYALYSDNGVMSKGPVLRIRIGDVMAQADGRGLPGFFDGNLSFEYTDAPWEISHKGDLIPLGMGPMVIKVSLTFTVIHEKNPAVSENYGFDTSIFRSLGDLPEEEGDLLADQEENINSEVDESTITPTAPPEE